ncbi:MAG: glycosyltransferase family 9 protein [Gammaproteobacteria bacterium]|nr:glycosyltransferase family 9 protein [Gammaproteobacteria bacterium]MCP5137520.1 glycosyltransferase family 9 protein [Gammaproteobacteria bacterium]
MNFLIIRRDNIGDLVCSTPLIRALREHYPDAWIGALVNSYNAPVLDGNTDLNAVFSYTKAKHRATGVSKWAVYRDRARMLWTLRRKHIDYAIIAGANHLPRALRLARFVAPEHVIGFTPSDGRADAQIDCGIQYDNPKGMHEVEDVFRLLTQLGIVGEPPPMRVVADYAHVAQARAQMRPEQNLVPALIGLHISARKPDNRWATDDFIEIGRRLRSRFGCRLVLFWSPGSEDNVHHPGDDGKAAAISDALSEAGVVPYPTDELGELITGLACCDALLCSDGGAMHIAAALQVPMVCMFGPTDASRWHPWRCKHRLLQPVSRRVADVSVDEVEAAFASLLDVTTALDVD